MLYFAYGSNMYTPRLRYRVKSAKPVGVAVLEGYELRWHKRSQDGSGKCSAFPAAGRSVTGVVFDFDSKEKGALDRAEGVGYGYQEKQVDALLNGKATNVFTYVADSRYIDDSLRPYSWYKDFVVLGANEHGLPSAYIKSLQAQLALTDPQSEREKDERAKVTP
jgi:gamma-glutamylcyclotransferase (GGCT)/AIG2-like uncharacterized protein YtfP